MSTKELLSLLKESKGSILVTQSLIERIPEFKKKRYISSIENVARKINGDKQLIEFIFHIDLLSDWCNENDIEFYLGLRDRIYRFKNKKL